MRVDGLVTLCLWGPRVRTVEMNFGCGDLGRARMAQVNDGTGSGAPPVVHCGGLTAELMARDAFACSIRRGALLRQTVSRGFGNWTAVSALCVGFALACSDSEDGDDNVAGAGGILAAGGQSAAGGSAGGSTPASGGGAGTPGMGGFSAGGSAPASGGATTNGGASSMGGAMAGAGGMEPAAGGATGSGGDVASGGSDGGGPFTLTSGVVEAGEMLPGEHRCLALAGDTGPSPPLSWTGAPPATASFAVTLTDVTPGASSGFAHWTIYDIPASTSSLPEGVPAGATLSEPAGAKQSPNQGSFLPGPGYFGPCGGQNTYEFEVYALDVGTLPGVTGSSGAAEVRSAIEMHSLGSAVLSVLSSP